MFFIRFDEEDDYDDEESPAPAVDEESSKATKGAAFGLASLFGTSNQATGLALLACRINVVLVPTT